MAYPPQHRRHVCGFFFLSDNVPCYLPQVGLRTHTTILAASSRTALTQTFVAPADGGSPHVVFNPGCRASSEVAKLGKISELRYVFPLYDGVSVVAFTCRIGDRVIEGVVRGREEARATYDAAVAQGRVAGLLEQSLAAADVFTTTVGNVPTGATITVEITYLGELANDLEVDGLRFTIPTEISPRYGNYPGELLGNVVSGRQQGMEIVVDAELAGGGGGSGVVKAIQSPSHPISVSVGTTSGDAPDAEPSPHKASATLASGSVELDKDFVVQIVAAGLGDPSAVLETHPTIPDQRALMATLVPKFTLPAEHPEIVFVCDRSGSMGGGTKIPNLVAALRIFLKSLPVGVRFNICSFGSRFDFLFPRSEAYGRDSLARATRAVDGFAANYGGTDIYRPLEAVFAQRRAGVNLEVFLITDGDIWDQERVFGLVNDTTARAAGSVRVFTLGVGAGASSSLVEGVARAGNGFAQTVGDSEKMDRKIVRMLRAALTPHVTDYRLEVRYAREPEDDFELVEKVEDCLVLDLDDDADEAAMPAVGDPPGPGKTISISLFNPGGVRDAEAAAAAAGPATKYDGLPSVAVPGILQAPHAVPALFSFNRTTVYLLFSGASARRTPTSVVLRGTSAHGPLELEIPVADAGTGQTVHQLAARKAVKELEEGRGWISDARDKDGRLLKDRYPGRFPDMAEREAVRLGVRFGVGGKWCSFVAVEKGKDGKAECVIEEGREDDIRSSGASVLYGMIPSTGSAKHKRAAGRPRGMGTAVHKFVGGASLGFAATNAPLPTPDVDDAVVGGSRGGGGVGGGVGGGGDVFGLSNAGATAPAPVAAKKKSSRFNAMAFSRSRRSVNDGGATAAASRNESGSAERDRDRDCRASYGAMPGAPPPPPPPAPGGQTGLDALIDLQTWEGSWTWSDELGARVGARAGDVRSALAASGHPWAASVVADWDAGKQECRNAVLTVCVVLFMKKHYAGDKETWEMVVDKAMGWVDSAMGGRVTASQLEEVLSSLAPEGPV